MAQAKAKLSARSRARKPLNAKIIRRRQSKPNRRRRVFSDFPWQKRVEAALRFMAPRDLDQYALLIQQLLGRWREEGGQLRAELRHLDTAIWFEMKRRDYDGADHPTVGPRITMH